MKTQRTRQQQQQLRQQLDQRYQRVHRTIAADDAAGGGGSAAGAAGCAAAAAAAALEGAIGYEIMTAERQRELLVQVRWSDLTIRLKKSQIPVIRTNCLASHRTLHFMLSIELYYT